MRVVSLLPGATDTIVALGGGASLVGVSHACDAGGAGDGAVAVVTASRVDGTAASGAIDTGVRALAGSGQSLYRLDRETIAGLRPDLIVTQALCEVCAVSEGEVRALAGGIDSKPRVLSLSGSTVEGILGDIGLVGNAIGLADEADELALGLRRRVRTVHERLKAARAPRPRVAVIEWTDPLFNGGHWVPEQVKRAGGVEVLGEAGSPSRLVTAEALRSADPEVVIVAPCGYGLVRAAAEARQLVDKFPWLRNRVVWAIDANALTSRPGPKVVTGIEIMAGILAPSLFAIGDARALRV